jgi:GntR family transcriptional regulator/MocR family aminotransferase
VATARRGARVLSSGPGSRVAAPDPWLKGAGPFHLGRIALERFPFAAWRRLLARHARRLDESLLGYGDPAGLGELREAIAAYVRTARGVVCEADQVLVVNGSQQALDLVSRVLLEPGSRVFFEEPGYWGARDAFVAAGARLVPVPVDSEGLDVKAGIALCPSAQAAYVTPSHQFPTGVLMSASRRLELLHWARTSGAWIVEDDYDSEYRYESLPVAALQGLDRDARVLYVGTFSKVLAPGLRMGYLVVPPDLVERFRVVRWSMDICPPALLQAVLADFLAEGSFARHLRRMRALYRERRAALVDSLRNELGGLLRVEGERAGLHLLAVLAGGGNDRELAYRAAEDGLRTLPLSSCYLAAAKRQGFVLGYGGLDVPEIPSAVRRLARVLRDARASRREASAG